MVNGKSDFSTKFFGYMVISAIWSTLPGQNRGPYMYPKPGVLGLGANGTREPAGTSDFRTLWGRPVFNKAVKR